jgi:hypothetical protein
MNVVGSAPEAMASSSMVPSGWNLVVPSYRHAELILFQIRFMHQGQNEKGARVKKTRAPSE